MPHCESLANSRRHCWAKYKIIISAPLNLQTYRYTNLFIIIIFWPSVKLPREFKNWDIQNWVQIYQSVQSGVGKLSCNKTALKRSLAPKLFGTEKLLPCHHLRMRRSSFPNYQRVDMLTCSKVPRFQPRLERRGTDCQCWHTFPPCGKRQALLQHLPRRRTQWRRTQLRGRWQLRPSTMTCRSAMGRESDHQVSSRLCGTTPEQQILLLLLFIYYATKAAQ